MGGNLPVAAAEDKNVWIVIQCEFINTLSRTRPTALSDLLVDFIF
jgi:hypothetical protein